MSLRATIEAALADFVPMRLSEEATDAVVDALVAEGSVAAAWLVEAFIEAALVGNDTEDDGDNVDADADTDTDADDGTGTDANAGAGSDSRPVTEQKPPKTRRKAGRPPRASTSAAPDGARATAAVLAQMRRKADRVLAGGVEPADLPGVLQEICAFARGQEVIGYSPGKAVREVVRRSSLGEFAEPSGSAGSVSSDSAGSGSLSNAGPEPLGSEIVSSPAPDPSPGAGSSPVVGSPSVASATLPPPAPPLAAPPPSEQPVPATPPRHEMVDVVELAE